MTSETESAESQIRWAVDGFVISNGLLFAYGWGASGHLSPEKVMLELQHDNGETTRIPATAGLDRRDVSHHYPGLPDNTGFLIYTAIGSRPVLSASLCLSIPGITETVRLSLPQTLLTNAPRLATSGGPGLLATWHRLASKAWLHLRQGNFSFLREHAARLLPRLLSTRKTPDDLEHLLTTLPEGMSLIVDHDLGGGANIYRDRLVARLRGEGQTVALLVFTPATLGYHLKILRPGQASPLTCCVSPNWWLTLAASRKFSTVYFNNCVSHPEPERAPAILLHFKRAGAARLVIFIHDFHTICPSHFLLNDQGRYCGIPATSTCETCLPRMTDNLAGLFIARNIHAWRDAWRPCLEAADELICFAASGRELLLRAYPSLTSREIVIRPHEIPPVTRQYRPPAPDAPLTIAIVGMINHHKGSQIALDLAQEIGRRALPARICIVGTLNATSHSKVIFQTGRYQPQDLPSILTDHGVQLALMPSICPETFSFVTHELIATGIPLMSFDLGAQGDAVRTYRLGRVVPMKPAAQLLDDILAFRTELEHHPVRPAA